MIKISRIEMCRLHEVLNQECTADCTTRVFIYNLAKMTERVLTVYSAPLTSTYIYSSFIEGLFFFRSQLPQTRRLFAR